MNDVKITVRQFFNYVNRRFYEHVVVARALWDLLELRSRTCCSIPSDRIFALLAIVKGGDNLIVSYEEDLGDLF